MEIMDKLFRCTSIVAVPNNKEPERDNYLIDVWVYDDLVNPEFKTSHYDPEFNYVAFVTFYHKRNEPAIYWNIMPKNNLIELGQERWSEVWDNVNEYKQQYESKIIEIATKYFNIKYIHLL